MMTLVSVVVPTHNRPEYLAEALASVRAQTFTDYEILVVSNGESAEMRARSEAAAAGCRYFTLDRGNVSLARNFGIDQAKGEWIAVLDDDDLFVPTKLERQIAAARETGADMIAAGYVEFWNDGHEVIFRPRPPESWSYTKAANHHRWWASTGTTLIRKSVYQKLGGFDPDQRHAEDNDMWRRVSWRHKIHWMDDIVLRYRRGHPSLMQEERRRCVSDLRHFVKMHLDTPSDLRSTLPPFGGFVWNRLAMIVFPTWLSRKLEMEPWRGPQWHRLLPTDLQPRWIAFKRMLRPRTRMMQLRGYLKIRTRAKAAVRAITGIVGL